MKNFFTIIISLFICSLAHAQCEIDNPSFETWTDQPVEVETFDGTVFANDVAFPDSSTTVIRLLFQAFGVLFDPAIGQLLEDDPQAFIGFSQSNDASDGLSAIRLQGTPDLSVADIYSPNECSEVPDSFHFDVKHVDSGGITDDTLIVFMTFDMGLSPLPEDSTQLANSPYSAYGEFIYNTDTEYHTISLPITENFQQEVDTFYYLIVSATHDGSSFLIDNLRFTEEGDSDCSFDNYPAFSIESDVKACFCNDFSETILLDNVTESDEFDVYYLVVDENDLITEISELNSDFIEQDLCFEDEAYLVELRFTEIMEIGTGLFLDELEGCFAVSERKEITGEQYDDFFWSLSIDGVSAPENFSVCLADDVIELFDFSYDTDRRATAVIISGVTSLIVEQFELPASKTFENLNEGESYSTGLVLHDQPMPDLTGVSFADAELLFIDCVQASINGYFFNIEESGTENCISNTQDVELLNAIKIMDNPTMDNLKIDISSFSGSQLSLQVFNLNGQAVSQPIIIRESQRVDINTDHLTGGIYLLNVKSDTGQASFKFLKI